MLRGLITVRGVVQGVGFRPFVYAEAVRLGLSGTVKNLGSEVEVRAAGERFEELVASLRRGPPLSRIDSVEGVDGSAMRRALMMLDSALVADIATRRWSAAD